MQKITVAKDDGFGPEITEATLKILEAAVDRRVIPHLLSKALDDGIDVIKTENLYTFNGERRYSLGQGQ